MVESASDDKDGMSDDDMKQLAWKLAGQRARRYRGFLDRDEVFSLALEAVWTALQRYDPDRGDNIGGLANVILGRLLCEVTRKEFGRFVRTKRPQKRQLAEVGRDGTEYDPPAPEPAPPAVDPLDSPAFWERVRSVLTPRQWEVMELKFQHGLKAREVAERLGCALGNRQRHDPPGDGETIRVRTLVGIHQLNENLS